MIRTVKDGIRWELAEDFEPLLDDVLASEGKLVKESPAKRVASHTACGRGFYVKQYRHAAVPLRPLKFFFRRSQARAEWQLAHRLQQLEVPTVRHVALGERWAISGLQESILITEAFDGVPLHLAQDLDMAGLFGFVHRMHERGVLQRDLHPANVLVCEDNGEIRLVDLHGTMIRSALAPAERAANFAWLRMYLPIPVNDEICRLSDRLRKKTLAGRSRRCLGQNQDFARRSFGELVWQVRLARLGKPLLKLLEQPDAFLETEAHLIKESPSVAVGAAHGWVLKRRTFRKPGSLLKALFRHSWARRAFHQAFHLERAGVPTARAVAAADRHVWGFPACSYFVMEEIAGAAPLRKWSGETRQAARAAAELLAKLHNEGFSHRDLKESNIVFDDAGRFFLIDLEGLDYLGDISHHRAVSDLAHLEASSAARLPQFSRADRLVFLRRYCKRRGIRPSELTRIKKRAEELAAQPVAAPPSNAGS